MVGTQKESGLSEVIGFILIIAILVVVASLYVTYVVPAHGREAEIAHMTYIKNQFVDFKMAMDSLWINSQVNTSLSQSIEMGTLGQKTEGQFVFLPLTQPIGSDGEMKLSTDPDDGTIQISMTGLFNQTEEFTPGGVDQSLSIKGNGDQIFVNPDFYKQMLIYQSKYPAEVKNMISIPKDLPILSTVPNNPNDFSFDQSLNYHLIDITPESTSSTPKWTASLNLTRVPAFYVPDTPVDNASKFQTDNWAGYMKAEYRYDLVMNLNKRNMTTGDVYPVFTNLTIKSYNQKPSNDIILNLQDPAYGLDTSGPISVKDSTGNVSRGVFNISRNADINITDALNMTELTNAIKSSYYVSGLTTPNITMGKFSYTGKNYYWVAQEFYAQMGGVFLVQNLTEGSVTKVLPLITLGVSENITPTPSISVTRLIFDGQNTSIAGSTSVQIVSRVSGIRKGIIGDELGEQWYIAPTQENVRQIRITIGPPDMPEEIRQMWIDVFNSLIYTATLTSPFQASWATVSQDAEGNVIFELNGPDGSNLWNDVTVDYTEVNANVVLQPVGWQGS